MDALTKSKTETVNDVILQMRRQNPDRKLYQLWQPSVFRWIVALASKPNRPEESLDLARDYQLNAFVFANSFEEVFREMNPGDEDEARFDERCLVLRHDWRSCSVGDVIVNPDGQAVYVASVGFRQIPRFAHWH